MTGQDPSAFLLLLILALKALRLALVLSFLWICAVGVHEIGHVVAGRLHGFRVNLIRVSFFTIFTNENGWNLHAQLRRDHMASGMIAAFPHSERSLALRVGLLMSAGIAANLTAAVASMALVWLVIGHWLEYVLVANVLISMVIAGMSTVISDFETRDGARKSDGAWIQELASRKTRDKALAPWKLEMVPWGCVVAGHPACRSGITFEALEKHASTGSKDPSWTRFLAGLIACETGHLPDGRRLLTESLSGNGTREPPRNLAGYQLALLDALDGRTDDARTRLCWNASTAKERLEPVALCVVQAAILLSEGETDAAREALKRWDEHISEHPFHRAFARGISAWARKELERRLGTAPDRR